MSSCSSVLEYRTVSYFARPLGSSRFKVGIDPDAESAVVEFRIMLIKCCSSCAARIPPVEGLSDVDS